MSLLADVCADARIPVPPPEALRPGFDRSGRPLVAIDEDAQRDGLDDEAERTSVRGSEWASLNSVVPARPIEALSRRRPPRPRRRSAQRTEVGTDTAPATTHRGAPAPPKAGGRVGLLASAGEGDVPPPQRPAAKRPERLGRGLQPPPDERTEWDPAPPAAMQDQARRERGAGSSSGSGTDREVNARRAERIFALAVQAYVRGDVGAAAADAMLARVFDPAHDGYARAEHDWTEPARPDEQLPLDAAAQPKRTRRGRRRGFDLLSLETP